MKRGRRTYFTRDGAAEEPAGPTGTDCPVFNVVWIGPHQVCETRIWHGERHSWRSAFGTKTTGMWREGERRTTERALVRDLLCARNHADLVKRANVWGETPVYTEDGAIDDLHLHTCAEAKDSSSDWNGGEEGLDARRRG